MPIISRIVTGTDVYFRFTVRLVSVTPDTILFARDRPGHTVKRRSSDNEDGHLQIFPKNLISDRVRHVLSLSTRRMDRIYTEKKFVESSPARGIICARHLQHCWAIFADHSGDETMESRLKIEKHVATRRVSFIRLRYVSVRAIWKIAGGEKLERTT